MDLFEMLSTRSGRSVVMALLASLISANATRTSRSDAVDVATLLLCVLLIRVGVS